MLPASKVLTPAPAVSQLVCAQAILTELPSQTSTAQPPRYDALDSQHTEQAGTSRGVVRSLVCVLATQKPHVSRISSAQLGSSAQFELCVHRGHRCGAMRSAPTLPLRAVAVRGSAANV